MKFEGKNAVSEILKSDKAINNILISNTINRNSITEIIKLAKNRNVKYQFVDNNVLKKMSETNNHQGIIAIAEDFKYSELDEVIKNQDKPLCLLILDGIEDPHNFGSIIRSAECFGVDGIIIQKNRACQVTETVIKTSAGAISHVKIIRVTNINSTIESLKKQNFWVYGLELGGRPIAEVDFSGNIAVVIGSEGKGTKMQTKSLCDEIVTLDLKGKVNSLNASVATGIGLYEITRNR